MDSTSVIVNEIFYSIQGESTYTGFPCIFVRLTGCNLRCAYCDTRYAYEEGREMTLREILEAVGQYDCKLVEVTGGEPLVQEGVYELMEELIGRSYRVLLETNGSLDAERVHPKIVRIIDLKCPGSGESDTIFWGNLDALRATDQIKFVLSDRRDYEWVKEMIGQYHLIDQVEAVLLSPVFERLKPEHLAAWMLEDGLNARLQLQLHKYIWEPDRRGV